MPLVLTRITKRGPWRNQLTDKELRALFVLVQSATYDRRPAAQRKLFAKIKWILHEQMMERRQEGVFAAGAKAGRGKGTIPKPSYKGHDLGSMECSTFYDGVASTRKGFNNSHGRK